MRRLLVLLAILDQRLGRADELVRRPPLKVGFWEIKNLFETRIQNIFYTSRSSHSNHAKRFKTAVMVYPDTFEGFIVESHSEWSDFKKRPVSLNSCNFQTKRLLIVVSFNSSNPKHSKAMMLTLKLRLAVSVEATCTL